MVQVRRIDSTSAVGLFPKSLQPTGAKTISCNGGQPDTVTHSDDDKLTHICLFFQPEENGVPLTSDIVITLVDYFF